MSGSYTAVGGGAIGGTLAFHLAGAGHRVLVVDSDAAHVPAIRERGLSIRRADGTERSRLVEACTPDEVTEPLGAVILAVKAKATTTAASWIAPRLAADGYVASLQNGLCDPEIAAAVGSSQSAEASVASNDDARSSTSSARSSLVVKEKPTPNFGHAPWRPPPAPEWPNATSAGP